ncbi:MAG: nuclear transport factor 2 family protein [Haliea sp.]|uniref:nuclear transport factor 2 family protein n=1 Tax=Haliea sp. TaxID=1932666 RepID=UPI0032EB5524
MLQALAQWHEIARSGDPARLDALLAEDCVFWSPVVHRPQQGRDLTRLYLSGAMRVFNDSFRYVKEVVAEPHAVLEFTCDIDGITVNGVDIITFNAAGKIIEFKVMVRPLQGVNMLHAKMAAMLEQLAG